jgi:outer membrane receptor protein involved in Fe transport
MKKLILIFTLIFLFTQVIHAQVSPPRFQIKGMATDSVSGAGLPYATISVQNETKNVVKRLATDINGKFDFTLTTTGKYELIIQSVGFGLGHASFTLKTDKSKVDLGTIRMSEGVQKIDEVSVVATKPLVRTEVDKIVYSIEVDPEAKTNNALEMLRKVPLVTVDAEDNIQVKGSSSFKILVNGKTSTMMSQNPKDVLKSLPANTIKDIEVITNPSSKYDAEGTGGIINIITTKKQLDGFMGRVGGGFDSRGGYNLGLYATSKIKKFGFSLNYSFSDYRTPKAESFSDRENFLSTNNRYTRTDGFSKYKGFSNMLSGEASYEIDSLNLISLSVWGYTDAYDVNSETGSMDFDINRVLTRHYTNKTTSAQDYGSISGNIDYQRTFKKPDKTFTISYRLDRSPRNSDNLNDINGILNYFSYRQRSENEASGTEQTFQVDYYDPLTKKHQIESGLKYIFRQNVSNTDISRYDFNSEVWIPDNTRKNDMDYDQHIFGLYAGYVFKLEKLSIKSGMRAEGTVNDGLYKSTTNVTFTNKMFNLIPYITISKNLKQGQNLKLSYTQRLSRPGISLLNPYVNDVDPFNISHGNPKLDAEVSHTFDFVYGKFTSKYNLNLSLNSAFTNNSIQSVATMDANGVKTTTYENIGKNQRYGGYLYGSVKMLKQKVTFNTNVSAMYSIMESNDSRNLKNEGFNYSGTINCRVIPWKDGNLNGYIGFNSPRVMLQGKSSAYYYTSFGFSQELFKKKVTASVSVTDPFRKRLSLSSTYKDQTFTQTSSNYNYLRQYRVSFSYRFGQLKSEIKRARRGISNDDVKSGDSSGSSSSGTQSK